VNVIIAPPAPRRSRLRALVQRYRNLLLYAVIGGGALVVDLGIYALLVEATALHPVFANTVSTFAAMVASFGVNSVVNFKVRDRIVARFISFALVTGAGWIVSSLMLALLVDVLHSEPLLAKGLTLPVVVLLQYRLNSRITFAATTGRNVA
jgi:putative flippase GtrA